MAQDWLAVFDALKSVYSDQAFSNIAINEAVEHHQGCSSGFVRTFTKGVIRDSILLDYYIENLAEKGLKGIKTRTKIVLRMGLYAISKLDSVPDYAAVNEAVALAKKVSKGSDRFVNAMLRAYIRQSAELRIPQSNLSLKYSFPAELVEYLRAQYPDEIESILAALSEPAPMVLRTNLTKISRSKLVDKLQAQGIKAQPVDESKSAIICEGGNIIATELFNEGLFSVQSLSSILAIEAFGPEEGSEVLDMCAAPGGKTAAMAEMMNNKGHIVSCDVYDHRLELIEATCRRLDIDIVETMKLDGTEHRPEFEDKFDYVLADVPCSGLGVIAGKPELKLRTDIKEYPALVGIQKEILKNAISYAKSGALIEYSTCTINKEENDKLVESVLSECSLAQILEKKTFMPYNNKIGFFYCIIRKSPTF